ncbi:hypothetical protein ACTA71_008566 [Dictyostelium dimigraforme]
MNKEYIEKGYHTIGINRGSPAKIYYEIYGNKNAKNKILCVSGLGQPGSSWKFQVEYFKKLSDFQICTFDNRGVGKSNSFTYSTKSMAIDVIDLIKCLKWDNVNIIGISLGGSTCFHICNFIEKELVNSVIISCPFLGLFPYFSFSSLSFIPIFFRMDMGKKIEEYNKLMFSENYLNSPSKTFPPLTKGQAIVQRFFIKNKTNLKYDYNLKDFFCWGSALYTHYVSKSILNNILHKRYLGIGIIGAKMDYFVNLNSLKRCSEYIQPLNFYEFNSGHCVFIEKSQEFNTTVENHIIDANKSKCSQNYKNVLEINKIKNNNKFKTIICNFIIS